MALTIWEKDSFLSALKPVLIMWLKLLEFEDEIRRQHELTAFYKQQCSHPIIASTSNYSKAEEINDCVQAIQECNKDNHNLANQATQTIIDVAEEAQATLQSIANKWETAKGTLKFMLDDFEGSNTRREARYSRLEELVGELEPQNVGNNNNRSSMTSGDLNFKLATHSTFSSSSSYSALSITKSSLKQTSNTIAAIISRLAPSAAKMFSNQKNHDSNYEEIDHENHMSAEPNILAQARMREMDQSKQLMSNKSIIDPCDDESSGTHEFEIDKINNFSTDHSGRRLSPIKSSPSSSSSSPITRSLLPNGEPRQLNQSEATCYITKKALNLANTTLPTRDKSVQNATENLELDFSAATNGVQNYNENECVDDDASDLSVDPLLKPYKRENGSLAPANSPCMLTSRTSIFDYGDYFGESKSGGKTTSIKTYSGNKTSSRNKKQKHYGHDNEDGFPTCDGVDKSENKPDKILNDDFKEDEDDGIGHDEGELRRNRKKFATRKSSNTSNQALVLADDTAIPPRSSRISSSLLPSSSTTRLDQTREAMFAAQHRSSSCPSGEDYNNVQGEFIPIFHNHKLQSDAGSNYKNKILIKSECVIDLCDDDPED